MANGMSSLYVGASALQSAQTALNTTAHNLANINTTGYTRQQVTFTDNKYITTNTISGSTEKYGLGVTVAEINRIRNEFIDSAYRSENSRLGFYSSQYSAVEEVEDLFGEMDGVTYQEQLENLYSAVNALSTNPSSTVNRASLIQYASAFLKQSNAIYSGLKSYQSTLNTQVKNMVSTINELGNTISELNEKIAKIEASGNESANDLRDQRDAALDELSEYISIDYYEGSDGRVRVNAEGVSFVTASGVNEMSTRVDSSAEGLLIPTWTAFNKDVFSTSSLTTSSSKNTDKGSLKGLLIARGYVTVDYTDVPVEPSESDYDLTTEEGQQQYAEDYAAYEEKQEYYNENIEPSVILSTMASLDKLVNTLVEKINDLLCPETTTTTTTALEDSDGEELQADSYAYTTTSGTLYTADGTEVSGTDNGDGTYSYTSEEKLYQNEDGTDAATVSEYTYTILDMDSTGYGMDDDQTVGEELFSRKGTDRYITTTDSDGNTVYVRNNLNERGNESLYTFGNLEMNSTVTQDTTKIPLSTVTGDEDIERAESILAIWSDDFGTFNPEEYASGTLDDFYNNMVGEYATVGSTLSSFVSNQTSMVDGYNDQRLEVSGVSSDEELEKMIKYQQAYNAASRYVSVVSDMMEQLVTSLGNG